MTTPDIRGIGEDVGIIEVYGAPISTFTRTITMSLSRLGLPFMFKEHLPHSAEVKQYNPLGLVPVLIHRPQGIYAPHEKVVILYESNAIRRWIDDVLTQIAHQKKGADSKTSLTPPLDTTNSATLLATAQVRSTIDQIVSLLSTKIFSTLEGTLIKPRQAMEGNEADEATIKVALEEALDGGEGVLRLLEGFLRDNAKSQKKGDGTSIEWFAGDGISWADLYVYPVLADFKSVPEVSR